jgi:hypothetical protein
MGIKLGASPKWMVRMMGRIFGTERDEVTGEWRKVQKEELQNFNSSPNMIKMIKEDEIGEVYSMK